MAGKLKNLSNAFKDAKSRTILLILFVIMIIALLVGYFGFTRTEQVGATSRVSLQITPKVQSLPGTGEASREYIRKQQDESFQRAQRAAKEGGSAVPSLTRGSYVGPSEFSQTASSSGRPECSLESLRRARAAGVRAEELRCKGCTAAELRAAGYTAGELMAAGFSAQELAAAGFSAAELRDSGFTAAELRRAGFSAEKLVAAGFNAAELNQAGFSENDLLKAGVNSTQLASAGIGVTPSANMPKNCDVDSLRTARLNGISAAEIRRKLGCGAGAMRAAGYTAAELKAAGYSAKELRDAGFSAAELRDAGFTVGELRQAGFSDENLRAAGFSAANLRESGASATGLRNAGFNESSLKQAGYTQGELIRAGFEPSARIAPFSLPQPGQQTTSGGVTTTTTATRAPMTSNESDIAALERIQERQLARLNQEQREERMQQLQTAMTAQMGDLFSAWTPPPAQQMVVAPKKEEQEEQGQGLLGAQGAGSTTQKMQQAATAAPPAEIIKAGSIMFAVLDTSVNSDEESPVMATIVQGELKGAKLVGTFNRVNKKVVLSFNLISIPDQPKSIALTAVAIDPNTARTALASHVDNHYMLRYGSLFASSFLSGLADAISDSGSTTTFSLTGVSETRPELTTGEKGAVALGEVGKAYSTAFGSNFQTPPTVTVREGSGIGILFMSDLDVPKV